MYLRHRLRDPQKRITIGMACLAAGIVLQRFAPRLFHSDVHNFAAGFITGVSGVLIGLSIVLNLTGLMMRRRGEGAE